MAINLQPATERDIDVVLGLMRGMYAVHELHLDESASREVVLRLIRTPEYGWLWLIVSDETIVGYAVVTFVFSIEAGGRNALIDEFYIDEAYRDQGLGSQALKWIEAKAKASGFAALHLEVTRPNVNARRLYLRHGYEEHDRYLMTKWLGDTRPTAH